MTFNAKLGQLRQKLSQHGIACCPSSKLELVP